MSKKREIVQLQSIITKAEIKDYKFVESIKGGGNGRVYKATRVSDGENVAIKILYKDYKATKNRFLNEINIMKDNFPHIEGIIPILDCSTKDYWYTMPLCMDIITYINRARLSIEEIVDGTIELAYTLSKLHENGISHRDIKPGNILYYNDRFCLGDFGLVDFPDKIGDDTRNDRGLGAVFTIAPEMKRNPETADGKKADVYSLAKTLWMFLTNDSKGFDGEYSYYNANHSLRSFEKLRSTHLVEIEELLKISTNDNPDLRPTMDQFLETLKSWKETIKDYAKQQRSQWEFLNKLIMPVNTIPTTLIWTNIDQIISVLNNVGSLPVFNHMLFSSGGGLDFKKAERANENGAIYIYDDLNSCRVFKPLKMIYETFENNTIWNYFLIEFSEIEPIVSENVYKEERLIEDTPGHYINCPDAIYGVYDYETGVPLPKDFKFVCRSYSGKLLIVMKNSPYNQIHATYDGRHGKTSSDNFRSYVNHLILLYTIAENKQLDPCHVINNDSLRKKYVPEEYLFKIADEFVRTTTSHRVKTDEELIEFFDNNYQAWSFKDLLTTTSRDGNMSFYIKCEHSNNIFYTGKDNCFYLCSNGHFERGDPKDIDVYKTYNRQDVLKLREKIDERIHSCLELTEDDICCPITCTICTKLETPPSHIFTQDEIKNAMHHADDRKNNVLVVDENGYAVVIDADDFCAVHTYPASIETWCAGNNYVGKYSDLSSVKDSYFMLLSAWLSFLVSGEHGYMDYVDLEDETYLLSQIKNAIDNISS